MREERVAWSQEALKEGCSLTKPACKVSKATSEQPMRFMFITPALPRFQRQTVGFKGFLSFLE